MAITKTRFPRPKDAQSGPAPFPPLTVKSCWDDISLNTFLPPRREN